MCGEWCTCVNSCVNTCEREVSCLKAMERQAFSSERQPVPTRAKQAQMAAGRRSTVPTPARVSITTSTAIENQRRAACTAVKFALGVLST